MRGLLACGALCTALLLAPVARAHMPIVRNVALAPNGSHIALRMPGFGLLVRTAPEQPFEYVCDALLGLQPTEEHAPFVYRGDGSLLVGSEHGLRIVSADGCPRVSASGLIGVSVVALAVSASDADLVYAVTADPVPAVHRSDDGGEHWDTRAALPSGAQVTALLVDPADAERIYVSATTGAMQAVILVSDDGGASFTSVDQDRALTLLHVTANAARLFAMVRDNAVRGVTILRAEQPEGPWAEILNVNFFGGFAIDESDAGGAIWVGDEGGSVFRSTDDGDSFEDVNPETAVACLAEGSDQVWACTPGLSEQRALAVASDLRAPRAEFEDVVALAQVDRMVECAPEIDVSEVCALAWNEWRADVLGMAMLIGSGGSSGSDAGGDAGSDAGAGAGGAASADAGDDSGSDAGDEVEPVKRASGCAVTSTTSQASNAYAPASWLLLALWLRARRGRSIPQRT